MTRRDGSATPPFAFEVSPIGPRCFFSSYTVLILIVCEVFKSISIESAELFSKLQKLSSAASAVLIIMCTVFYFRIYFTVYHAEKERNQHIKDEIAMGYKTVELFHLPYKNWVWRETPTEDNDIWERRYKLFYGIPDEVDVIVTDHEPAKE